MTESTKPATPAAVRVLEFTVRDRQSGALGVVKIAAATAPPMDMNRLRAICGVNIEVQGFDVMHSRLYDGPAECLN